MTDRELLELAAKAAGIEIDEYGVPFKRGKDPIDGASYCEDWDPLTDDGDAFRLADQLQLNVDFCCYRVVRGTKIDVLEDVETGRKAIRRAIVRAAAEIGKGMK